MIEPNPLLAPAVPAVVSAGTVPDAPDFGAVLAGAEAVPARQGHAVRGKPLPVAVAVAVPLPASDLLAILPTPKSGAAAPAPVTTAKDERAPELEPALAWLLAPILPPPVPTAPAMPRVAVPQGDPAAAVVDAVATEATTVARTPPADLPVADSAPAVLPDRTGRPALTLDQPRLPAPSLPAPAILTTAPVAPLIRPAAEVFAQALAAAPLESRRRGDDPVAVAAADPLRPAEAHATIAVAATGHAGQAGIDLTRDPGLQRMIDRIETLRDAADARDTRIRLVPDALGPVEVAVRRAGDQVSVHFTAADPATRQLIADAQPRLAELAEARGVRIDRATVAGGEGGQPRGQPQPPQPPRSNAPASAGTDPSTSSDDARIA